MCLYPRLILNGKYKANKKNDHKPPTITDQRVKYVPVGCGKCIECRKQKSREWQVRLLEDIKTHKNGHFITFTFSDKSIKNIVEGKDVDGKQIRKPIETLEGYELDNEIATVATRDFLERWRKKYGVSIRHWLVTELGHNGTENIHLHGIIWTNESLETVEQIWKYGFMWKGKKKIKKNNEIEYINYVNELTVGYITKYITKVDEIHTQYKSKILTSPGIGHNYTETIDSKKNKYKQEKTNETYRTKTGHKVTLPIYWRNKIYTETEREKLWLHKLDKEERWVMGQRIDISKGYKEYNAALKYYQNQNKTLGYGNQEKDWSREQYEREKRNLMNAKRIQKAIIQSAYAASE